MLSRGLLRCALVGLTLSLPVQYPALKGRSGSVSDSDGCGFMSH